MINFFSPRLGRLQIPSSRDLQIIPEEDEPRSPTSSSSRSSSPRPAMSVRRTFSTSYIEVSLADSDNDDQHELLSLPRQAPRPPVTPPKCTAYDTRSGATSPTPSTSSSSSCSPSTPTSSDDEFPVMRYNPRRASIRPLNIVKNNSQIPSYTMTSFIESDSEDESDSEWYSRELSKILSLSSPLPSSFPKQQPSRPESLSLEPLLTEGPITQPPCLLKRAPASRTHKRSRSAPKEAPPPVPTIPAQFLSSSTPSIPEIVELPSPPVPAVQLRPRALSLRRPPPRMSIPDDCLADDFVNGEDESSWSSAFDLAIYEQPSPAIISPAAQRLSSHLTVLDSPRIMYSPLPRRYSESHEEIQFAVDDVQFEFNMDMPLRLPLSLPNSPTDLETDFALGLEELWSRQEAGANEVVLPAIAVSDADARADEQVTDVLSSASVPETTVPVSASEPSSSLPPTPTSFESYYDSNVDAEIYLPEEEGSPSRPVLRSKWSTSTLASLREEHASRSKFAAANKLRLYFGGGSSPLSKSRQQQQRQHDRGKQQQQQQQQQQHKRNGSASAIAAAKAAVARATSGAIYHPSTYHPPSTPSGSSLSPSSVSSPASPARKKAQRQVVLVPPPAPYFVPRTPTTPTSPMSTSPLHGYGKKRWNGRHSEDVMVIGYGYGGVGRELRRRGSMTPTVSDAGSEESNGSSCVSGGGGGLRRKPIPVEMFLRGAAGSL